ncbi:hypothetical protein LSUE1_G009697, partial [Lachnellula suecica]
IFRLPSKRRRQARPPIQTAALLQSINTKTYILTTVVEGSPGVPPICKILSRVDLLTAEKKRKTKAKESRAEKTVKGLEMNWAIDKGDLGHRLGRLREWLGKGWKVEVVLAKKRKGREA